RISVFVAVVEGQIQRLLGRISHEDGAVAVQKGRESLSVDGRRQAAAAFLESEVVDAFPLDGSSFFVPSGRGRRGERSEGDGQQRVQQHGGFHEKGTSMRVWS